MKPQAFRMTTRGIAIAVLFVACALGFWAYLQRWEARRVVMYRQRDVTRAAMLAAREELAAVGRSVSRFVQKGDAATYTSHWTERVEAWEDRDGRATLLLRATASGENGRLSLEPVVVEVDDTPDSGPWLDRLVGEYRKAGWSFEVRRARGG